MGRNSYSFGILLIAAAIILLLGKLGVFQFVASFFWPLFILIPGLIFHYLYFNRIWPAGVLVPGGILVTYSLMFFYCNLFGWGAMGYLWPGFILGVAVGLYEFYLFDRQKERGLLYASMILGVISAAFFAMMLLFKLGIYLIALILVLAGIGLIMRKPRSWQ
jgi:hypothetical protein